MALKFSFVRLLVPNYAECVRFYRDVLGFELVWGDETTGYCDFQTGEVTLALFDRGEMAAAIGTAALPAQAEAQDRAALIFAVEDVSAAHESLRAKGISFVTEPHDQPDWGIRVAHFRDPGGTLIEIYTSLHA